jgi:hypothetical protein
MKTMKQRAKEFVDKMPLACSMYRKEIEEELIRFAQRQDQITHYAIAINVNNAWLDHKNREKLNVNDLYSDIHSAITNTNSDICPICFGREYIVVKNEKTACPSCKS